MTSHVVVAHADDTVGAIRSHLRNEIDHRHDIDAVLVVDDDGILVDDLRLFELFIADSARRLGDMVGEPWPLTVQPDTPLDEVIGRFIDARGSSIVVLDDDGRPVGRILADDLVDVLTPQRGRLHFPRILR